MLTTEKNSRTVPRISVKLFLHMFNEERFFQGTTVDLSCWGVRFKTSYPLETGDLIKLSFIFKSPYVLNTKVVEKLSENEYRGLFIFDDIIGRISLEKNVKESRDLYIR